MRRHFFGLRTRLLLMVLAAILPAFAVSAYKVVHERQDVAARAVRDTGNLVQLAAREQRRLVSSTRQLLVSLSKLPEIRRPTNPDACRRVLVDVLKPFPYYRNIGVALADGEVVCRSHPNPMKNNISTRPYFIRAVQSRDFGVGDYQIGPVTGLSSINFAQVALSSAGEVRVVIQAALDLDWLNQLIATNELPPASTLTVFDGRGTVAAHFPDPGKWIGKTLISSPLVQTILTRDGKGTVELVGPDGINRIYAFAPLHESPNSSVYVTVGLSTDVAFAAANKDFGISLVWLSVFGVIAFGLAWWVGDIFVLRRIHALTSAAKRLGDGDLSARTGLAHGQAEEIGQLAGSFDAMANALQLMNTVLSRINRALKTLGECNRAVARATDELLLMSEICRIITKVGRYRGAWIGYAEHDERKTIYPVAESWLEGKSGLPDEFSAETTWTETANGRRLAATAIRTVKPCIIRNFLTDPALAPWKNEAVQCGYASGAAFPMTISGVAVGVLVIYSEESDAFSQEEFELLAENVQDVSFGIAALRARDEHDRTLEKMAFFDTLTGLPNRAQFERLVHHALSEIDSNRQLLALMMIDLNRLWEINGALGFLQGDELLKEVGERLKKMSIGDAVVARMRGDEFAVLLRADSREHINEAALQILKVLNEPFTISNIKLDISVVIGISISPQDGTEPIQLLRHADVAMHQAKKTGGGFGFYSVENDTDNTARLAMVAELRHAIENNGLVLYYQPKIDMSSHDVCGVEALVRWIHPTRGMIPPDAFIPLAEETWLIKPLTEWVLEAALRQAVAWHKAGWNFPVAVNLSAKNLRDVSLVEKIETLISSTGAQASWLELEITEGAVMEDPDGALKNLNRLSALGITIFIDDFGTGYSSLGYLSKLPVDAMKIDKSFVLDMLTHRDSAAIVRSTIGLAHDLGLKVVAEGVEDEKMWDELVLLGCDVAQGYYISKPLPPEKCVDQISKTTQKRQAS